MEKSLPARIQCTLLLCSVSKIVDLFKIFYSLICLRTYCTHLSDENKGQ